MPGRIQKQLSEKIEKGLFSKTLPRFSPGYEGTGNTFITFIQLLFSVLTKRKTIYEVRVYSFISFMKL